MTEARRTIAPDVQKGLIATIEQRIYQRPISLTDKEVFELRVVV